MVGPELRSRSELIHRGSDRRGADALAQIKQAGMERATTESLVRLTAEHVDNELRLGRTLESKATAGEGVQNLIRAAQALAALIVLIGASSGLGIIDPLALC